jgi:hypothetical protein
MTPVIRHWLALPFWSPRSNNHKNYKAMCTCNILDLSRVVALILIKLQENRWHISRLGSRRERCGKPCCRSLLTI